MTTALKIELQQKAYKQGYEAGYRALPWSAADWEAEFLPYYRSGRDEGRKAKEYRDQQMRQMHPRDESPSYRAAMIDAGRGRLLR